MHDGRDALPEDAAVLRDSFVGWQCRIRQMAVRRYGGRPLPGMQPSVALEDGRLVADAVTSVILHAEPENATHAFRHIVRRTKDPLERHEAAVKMLGAAYYQHAREFSDVLTALFSAGSTTATALVKAGQCVLTFEQFGQTYRLPCVVTALDHEAPMWQGTYWHNHMFNAQMPADVVVLAFHPDWSGAEADPPLALANE